ncbi:MarR family transcriptional regulator [Fulvimarina sp. 2208YS6-2-32]|uniref:MarR family transcriptional regulator n=1 Tax=Fulvimarina uroteuthidis TaxID=3098149 RepID=A0ABU5I046_9HYPH|nr:MarR family transcriptional regulator [Fulvimarina sp. 2208YS6-2-32]MDY8108348.1 MarR family transcriptional regulator [Fulvimarina sp. 2208YS6-2-32]
MLRDKRDLIGQLTLTSRAVRVESGRELAALGLHAGQDTVLSAICESEGISLKDLAVKLGVRPPTVTKTIARLGAQGFVEKRASPDNTRQSLAYLTVEGRMVARELKAVRKKIRKIGQDGLSKDEQKLLVKLLRKVEGNFGGATKGEENTA